MKRLAVIAAIIAVTLAGFLLWQRLDEGARTFRLKATATVLVDGVERTGSAVQEFQVQKIYSALNGFSGHWRLTVRGEAVRIDVPGGEPIYALISSGTVFNNCAKRNGTQEELKESFLEIQHCEVTGLYPTTIRFDGSGNYQEAIAVNVGGQDRNGYQFVRMAFERTTDPVTEGRSPPNPWPHLNGPIKVHYDGKIHSVSRQDFKLEEFW